METENREAAIIVFLIHSIQSQLKMCDCILKRIDTIKNINIDTSIITDYIETTTKRLGECLSKPKQKNKFFGG